MLTYIIRFNDAGQRCETYVKEDMTEERYNELMSAGYEEVSEDNYQLLLGNVDGQEHIRTVDEDGNISFDSVYTPPEPTEAEQTASKAAAIASDYEDQLADLKDSMVTAMLMGDTELQDELKEEYTELITEYYEALEALNND